MAFRTMCLSNKCVYQIDETDSKIPYRYIGIRRAYVKNVNVASHFVSPQGRKNYGFLKISLG